MRTANVTATTEATTAQPTVCHSAQPATAAATHSGERRTASAANPRSCHKSKATAATASTKRLASSLGLATLACLPGCLVGMAQAALPGSPDPVLATAAALPPAA